MNRITLTQYFHESMVLRKEDAILTQRLIILLGTPGPILERFQRLSANAPSLLQSR
jgi:hypothetical protein